MGELLSVIALVFSIGKVSFCSGGIQDFLFCLKLSEVWKWLLWLYLLGGLLSFLNHWICGIVSPTPKFGTFSAIVSQHFFSPSSLSLLWLQWHIFKSFVIVQQVPKTVFCCCCFVFQYIFLCHSDWIISIVLSSSSLIHSSVIFILLLSSSTEVCLF